MINKDNFQKLLESLEFIKIDNIYSKKFDELETMLKVDIEAEKLIYPDDLKINGGFTLNFNDNENFVVFECVHRLLNQGYSPKHIELEPKWQLGHGASGGRADILIKDNDGKSLLIIECKTAGKEFISAWNNTLVKPTQLFSYAQQATSTQFIALYASDFIDKRVVSDYYLINLTDNSDILKKDKKLHSYKDSTTTEELYKVWRDTYKQDYTTLGIFENNKVYEIGLKQPTLKDLKTVTSRDIQSKYHEFATILRQHNVSGRENAFDKLVNLFLCKVTDEKENPNNLKFYYKGFTFDNPFDFQDRLQLLYKKGMDKFLDDEITYIDNERIENAFSVFKDKPNETKRLVLQYLKEQKFFTNNDFSFIDVHNEKLFYQNFEVLLKISRMIQDISLTTSDENQFLGDMFEGFLDQGIKQSEGQFFTPMPIVKFIINSMPKLKEPNVIDYACGSGHFLNEYSSIDKEAKITGIEKEYRLSKVAKVSSFMYGSDIDIIYSDALSSNEKIKNNFYNVLVANPPYSVKGFLETLTDEDRKKYELIKDIDEKSYSKNNAIECFFIERAKQLLTKNGVAGIILPSSILNKGDGANSYVKTREIILKNFDIVAIAEFGSGTFGKTGTNTITLFLKRKALEPNIAFHLENMINCWFECDFKTNQVFKDEKLLEKYCEYIEIDYKIYKTLICRNIDEEIFKNETFLEYKNNFLKLTDTISRKKKSYYKNFSNDKKKILEIKELLNYIIKIEKDKLLYFCLAYKNDYDVLIIKSPKDNKESKKFLGYEWSGRKGDEGIQYNSGALNSINTPLYNPKDIDDESKINSLIAKNFNKKIIDIPEELKKYVSKSKLVSMLDFSKKDFNKSLSLNPKRVINVIGKIEWQKKLGDVVDVKIGGTPSRANNEYFNGSNLWVSISEMNGQVINDTKEYISENGIKNSNVKLIPKGTTLLSFKLSIGKTAIAGKDLYTNEAIAGLIPKDIDILDNYLFCLFNGKIIDLEKDGANTFGKSLNSKYLKEEVKIPVPPLDIQKDIIKECEVVDNEVRQAEIDIEDFKNQINFEINSISGEMVKLGDITKTSSGGTPLTSIKEYYLNGTIPWINSGELKQGIIYNANRKITELGVNNSSAKLFPKNTILIAMYGATTGEVGLLAIESTTNQAVCGVLPSEDIFISKFLYFILRNNTKDFKNLSRGTARNNISQEIIKNFKIPLPPLETQKAIVLKIEKIELEINKSKKIIDSASDKKREILKRYL